MTAWTLEPLVPEFVRQFEAYVPSRPDPELMALYGVPRLFRLNNNENPLGPPAAAQEVLRRFPPPRAAVYPSGDSFYLRRRLGAALGVDPEQVLVGNGANEAIGFVIKAFCQEGDNIVTADRTFAVYEWTARFSGIDARLVPLSDLGFDDEGMLARIDARTKVLFVCNPNNPTGTFWDRERLRRFVERVDRRAVVVVDEAYAEFVEDASYPDGLALLPDHPNVVVFRTFSKMWGLAGLRVGYLVGERKVVDTVRRTCTVYSVNGLAQEAALAALGDDGHVPATRLLVREEKAYLASELSAMGLTVNAREGPYVMVELPVSDTLAYRRLMAEGVMVRTMTGFRFPGWIRVSIGRHDAMEAFVGALRRALA